MKPGCLVLETGEIFKGFLFGDSVQAGELVFNTSHTGYEEIASDPSYYNQILIMTAPLQGNYGAVDSVWESKNIWIKGFVCLEIQNSSRDKEWLERLSSNKVPVLSAVDTRSLVIHIRKAGALWAALLPLSKNILPKALSLIQKEKSKPKDWTQSVCLSSPQEFKGQKRKGPRLALIDFGYKKKYFERDVKKSRKGLCFSLL